jgi:hypothetical protein
LGTGEIFPTIVPVVGDVWLRGHSGVIHRPQLLPLSPVLLTWLCHIVGVVAAVEVVEFCLPALLCSVPWLVLSHTLFVLPSGFMWLLCDLLCHHCSWICCGMFGDVHGSYLKNNKSKHVVNILFRDVADVPNDVAPDHVLGSSSVGVRTRRSSPRWATNAILIV